MSTIQREVWHGVFPSAVFLSACAGQSIDGPQHRMAATLAASSVADQVAASKLAVDAEIEQGQFSRSLLHLQFPLFQGSLRAVVPTDF
jgi:hypothetical protein